MQIVYDIVQNVMVFVIWMSLVSHLLEKSSFGKYIRFFLGLLFLLVVISPVVEAFAGQNPVQKKLDLSFLDERREDVQAAMEIADAKMAEKLKAGYEEAMKEQIGILLGQEVSVCGVRADFSENCDKLLGVAVTLARQEAEAEKVAEGGKASAEDGKEAAGEAGAEESRAEESGKASAAGRGEAAENPVEKVKIEKISIGEEKEQRKNGNTKDVKESGQEGTEKQGEYIERIAAYYGLEETSVTLEWK